MPLAHITIELYLPESNSLKAKRSFLARLETALRKHNFAFAETGAQDHWQMAQIELAAVASEGKVLESRLAKLEDLLLATVPGLSATKIEIERF